MTALGTILLDILTKDGAHREVDKTFDGLDSAECRQRIHDIVDGHWELIGAVADLAAEQSAQHETQLKRLRASLPKPATSPPPSNETEAEKLQARQVKALEQIAYALTNAKGIQ